MPSLDSTTCSTERGPRGSLPLRNHARTLILAAVIAVLALATPGVFRYVDEHIAPFFGRLLLLAMGVFMVYACIELLGGSTHRLVRRLAERIDYFRQHRAARTELQRRVLSVEEEQRARMLSMSARIHEQAAGAIHDGKVMVELEKLRASSESVLLRAQAHEIERYVLRYEIAFTQLSNAPNMSSAEKARVIREMREQLQSEINVQEPGKEHPACPPPG